MLLQFSLRLALRNKPKLFASAITHTLTYSSKASDPLRVLFCGSDEFSVSALRELEKEKITNPSLIKSIDVLCRPGKPIGRGMRKIAEAPIKAAAQNLGLPVHETDTFTGWELPRPEDEDVNLVIAVSFGLFIPPRILKKAKYGGINLHPSILPNFRGPAPLHHTLLSGHGFTGATLQTLDHKRFDHGIVLDQTSPWLGIPDLCTYDELLKIVTPISAALLVKGLNQRLFLPPLNHVGWVPQSDEKLIHARKITSIDKKMPWRPVDGAKSVVRTYNALGCLWSYAYQAPNNPKRIKLHDISTEIREIDFFPKTHEADTLMKRLGTVTGSLVRFIVVPTSEGEWQAVFYHNDSNDAGSISFLFPIGVDSESGWSSVSVGKITVEGKQTLRAQQVIRQFSQDRERWCLKLTNESRPGSVSYFAAFPLPDSS
ncbi:putative methionyl-tRNA formyltransferase [Golovinomyces cichoracearum]|uniref:methionyl-tRNA formyltransferase n=1 Tax=Golovinomyces cichoracearum TaxID=62708 RepID=A0A420J5J7_9PEZI|nr:putative methionyl-tRNA formyltransferase [Golovinomyces cichoracearum]